MEFKVQYKAPLILRYLSRLISNNLSSLFSLIDPFLVFVLSSSCFGKRNYQMADKLNFICLFSRAITRAFNLKYIVKCQQENVLRYLSIYWLIKDPGLKLMGHLIYQSFAGLKLLNNNDKASLMNVLSTRVILDVLPSKDSSSLLLQSGTSFSTEQKMSCWKIMRCTFFVLL